MLEDLTTREFRIESLTRGLSLSQATAAVRALAKIHAASIGYKTKNKIDMRQKFPYLLTVDQALSSFQSLISRGLPLLIAFLQKKDEHKAIREKLQTYNNKNRIPIIIKRAFELSSKLNTLVHCDFWVNNLLFCSKGNETLCCIIDWQLVTYGSPAIDLALLMTTSLAPDIRRDYRKVLITSYYTELKHHLADFGCGAIMEDYDIVDLEEDMKRTEAMAALVMVGSVDLALGIPKREERVLSMLADYFERNVL